MKGWSLTTASAVAIVLFCRTSPLHAQKTAVDSAVARANQLAASGNAAGGRSIIDSLLAATSSDSPLYAEPLYWHAVMATSPAIAERDFRQIVVDYPLSRHAGQALLRLAQFEQQRGDREAATQHLQKFLIENPRDSSHARAGLALTKLLFEQGFVARGCVVLTRTLAEVPQDSVEFHNQLDFYSPRCANVDTTKAADPNQLPDSTAVKPGGTRADGEYTLQIAAYKKREDADKRAEALKKHGISTRIIESGGLFKVRTGRFKTRADALAEARKLDDRGLDVILMHSGNDDP